MSFEQTPPRGLSRTYSAPGGRDWTEMDNDVLDAPAGWEWTINDDLAHHAWTATERTREVGWGPDPPLLLEFLMGFFPSKEKTANANNWYMTRPVGRGGFSMSEWWQVPSVFEMPDAGESPGTTERLYDVTFDPHPLRVKMHSQQYTVNGGMFTYDFQQWQGEQPSGFMRIPMVGSLLDEFRERLSYLPFEEFEMQQREYASGFSDGYTPDGTFYHPHVRDSGGATTADYKDLWDLAHDIMAQSVRRENNGEGAIGMEAPDYNKPEAAVPADVRDAATVLEDDGWRNVSVRETGIGTYALDADFPETSTGVTTGDRNVSSSMVVDPDAGRVGNYAIRLPGVAKSTEMGFATDEKVAEMLRTIVSESSVSFDADLRTEFFITDGTPEPPGFHPHIESKMGEVPPRVGEVVQLMSEVSGLFEQYYPLAYGGGEMEAPASAQGVGFDAPDRASAADLFHITRSLDAESIARSGLLPSSMNRTEKIARDATGTVGEYDDDPEPFMDGQPPDMKADRQFDEILRDARRTVERQENTSMPAHSSESAVFFWAEEANASRATGNRMGPNNVLVAVDSRKVDGTFVKGDISATDGIYSRIREATSMTAPNPLSMQEQEDLFEEAVDYWENVVGYSYGDGDEPFPTAEVWTNARVPPEAIEAIYDPETGRVLYDPASADQRTLQEFEAARW